MNPRKARLSCDLTGQQYSSITFAQTLTRSYVQQKVDLHTIEAEFRLGAALATVVALWITHWTWWPLFFVVAWATGSGLLHRAQARTYLKLSKSTR